MRHFKLLFNNKKTDKQTMLYQQQDNNSYEWSEVHHPCRIEKPVFPLNNFLKLQILLMVSVYIHESVHWQIGRSFVNRKNIIYLFLYLWNLYKK